MGKSKRAVGPEACKTPRTADEGESRVVPEDNHGAETVCAGS